MASCSASSLIARTGQPLNSMIFSENSVGFISFWPTGNDELVEGYGSGGNTGCSSPLNWSADQITPLGPRTVIVLHIFVTQQVLQDKP